ncbi:toll/interleukin-1 receptor domain-containing protein [Pseudonocardia sp. ICBG1142]|uniref:toll/interleukin-1 receptor domain-containing protein n=1 Tax=Pseudonocardia sp. ICBG1142 TaxID=2846760 RepID=UPI001CF6EAF7|nr:toll/interleukin-1 receptor domain-containing protein [Pseudonocardia sp. ICBG1142]
MVTPLVSALMGYGLEVWVDERELKIGDSLRQRIDHGLAQSSFGVVILSRSFLRKGWTNYELDGIVSKTIAGKQRMLPIWHEITKDEIVEYSPTLVDRIARSTATYTLDEIATEIASVVRGDVAQDE